MSTSNPIPIDSKARGFLLRAVESFADFCEDADSALPALLHCGNQEMESRAAWIAHHAAEMRRALDAAKQGTCEARANAFPYIPKPARIETPIFRSKR